MEFAYEFQFWYDEDFDDAAFQACPQASPELRDKVMVAIESLSKAMKISPGIQNMAMPVEHEGLMFKVRVSRRQ